MGAEGGARDGLGLNGKKTSKSEEKRDRRRKGYVVEERRIDSSLCAYFLCSARQSKNASLTLFKM